MSRYCMTCRKTIKGRAIGAHIQHKHTVRDEKPTATLKATGEHLLNAVNKRAKDVLDAKKTEASLQNNPSFATTLDNVRAGEAAYDERLLTLHEKTIQVILLIANNPALIPIVEKLLTTTEKITAKTPLWLLGALGGVMPAVLAASMVKK